MKRVFVIDDDALMREVIARALSRHGYSVSQFADAAEVIGGVEHDAPDLIVSDVNMPRVSGLALARRLHERRTGIPLILVTADPNPAVIREAHDLRVHHVLRKPLDDIDGLTALVQRTIDDVDPRADVVQRLDGLRLDMLTELSHQLRTPLTAMRLALDGLSQRLDDADDHDGARLADTSRRNVDRIVVLVENQMRLLQMTLGEYPADRRRVDLREAVAGIARALDVDMVCAEGTAIVALTDPDGLAAVVTCMVRGDLPAARRSVAVDSDGRHARVLVEVDYPADGDPEAVRVSLDFERRAYDAFVRELGGEIELEMSPRGKRAVITLPTLNGPESDDPAEHELALTPAN